MFLLTMLGLGFNNTFGSNASAVPTEMDVYTSVEATLDSSGEFSIALANADTYSLVSITPQESLGAQSGFYRLDPTNTTHLKGAADIGAVANGKAVLVTYKLT